MYDKFEGKENTYDHPVSFTDPGLLGLGDVAFLDMTRSSNDIIVSDFSYLMSFLPYFRQSTLLMMTKYSITRESSF